MAKVEQTVVIFRRYPFTQELDSSGRWKIGGGDLIAIFPEEPSTNDEDTCVCYQHVGQHSSCYPDQIIYATESVSEVEYRELYEELVSLGYNLRVMRKQSEKFRKARIEKLHSMKGVAR